MNRIEPLDTASTVGNDATRCPAFSRSGRACPRRILSGKGFCALHDPGRAEARRAELQQRGKASAQKKKANKKAIIRHAVLSSAIDIRRELEEALDAVKQGEASPIEKANATARLCLAALAINRHMDLENEVEELRRLVAEQLGKEPPRAREERVIQ